MATAIDTALRDQLIDRKGRLEHVLARGGEPADLVRLVREVDRALQRLDAHTFGRCEVCGDPVEQELLAEHPLSQYCLCELTPEQRDTLQGDLDLAWRIQSALLPAQDQEWAGWRTHYRYMPAGPVSGDYCDLLMCNSGQCSLFFALGDVSGKGVAASFLMAHLNALFRSLNDDRLPLHRVVERANQIFASSTLDSHYATLVCGTATAEGQVQICNAGHVLPLVVRGGEVVPVDSTGFPVGIFEESPYEVHCFQMEPGDTLFLYSDGLSESHNPAGEEYGEEGIVRFLAAHHGLPPCDLAARALEDVSTFRDGVPRGDDLTMLVLRRTG